LLVVLVFRRGARVVYSSAAATLNLERRKGRGVIEQGREEKGEGRRRRQGQK